MIQTKNDGENVIVTLGRGSIEIATGKATSRSAVDQIALTTKEPAEMRRMRGGVAMVSLRWTDRAAFQAFREVIEEVAISLDIARPIADDGRIITPPTKG